MTKIGLTSPLTVRVNDNGICLGNEGGVDEYGGDAVDHSGGNDTVL